MTAVQRPSGGQGRRRKHVHLARLVATPRTKRPALLTPDSHLKRRGSAGKRSLNLPDRLRKLHAGETVGILITAASWVAPHQHLQLESWRTPTAGVDGVHIRLSASEHDSRQCVHSQQCRRDWPDTGSRPQNADMRSGQRVYRVWAEGIPRSR